MKRKLAALLLTIFALSLTACGETAAESETRTVYAMDTVMNLTVYGENAAAVLESAEKELHTLDEAVLSRTAEGSELYALSNSLSSSADGTRRSSFVNPHASSTGASVGSNAPSVASEIVSAVSISAGKISSAPYSTVSPFDVLSA